VHQTVDIFQSWIYLISKGANIETQDKFGWTPLYSASRYVHLSVVKLLISKGANIETPNKYGQTPLYCASQKGHLSVAKCLIDNGANINKVYAGNQSGRECQAYAKSKYVDVTVRNLTSKRIFVNGETKR
jgi:ankyrin repeat protein